MFYKLEEDLILYQEFFEDVKYSISEKLGGLINQAYETLNKNHEESVSAKSLVENYNVQGHPHSLTRRKSNEDIQS